MTVRVGLTGNVASGKTTVADRWRATGVRVIDADRLGHAVLAEDGRTQAALVEAFGPAIETADGTIDRAALGTVAFSTPAETARLNAIVHPPLIARLSGALAEAESDGEDIVIVDAALLFEFAFDAALDVIVLVTAPRALREERLRQRRGMDARRIGQRMAAQQPDIEKARASDYVIVNDGSLEELEIKADLVLAAMRSGFESTRGKGDGR